jgi:hypothetical protein
MTLGWLLEKERALVYGLNLIFPTFIVKSLVWTQLSPKILLLLLFGLILKENAKA